MAFVTAPVLFTVPVSDLTAASEARRLARMVATDAGLSATDAERAAIVATEAGTNLVKHAHGGEMVVRSGAGVVDILAIDRGRGMSNLAQCLRDGYTTAGTQGNGLGAIVRQSTFFDAYSLPGSGTVILSRIAAASRAVSTPDTGALMPDGLSLRKKGQSSCGDHWSAVVTGSSASVMVADGLGHGEPAADAALEAAAAFEQAPEDAPAALLDRIHRALIKTRGAAVAVARIDSGLGRVTFAGLGNISATIENGSQARHLVSLHGIAGHQARRLQEFTYPWSASDVLVMHSDGVNAHWSLDKYPGLSQRHPLVIAAVLLRDFSRGRDDATVVVTKAETTSILR